MKVAIYVLCESITPADIRYVGQAVNPEQRLKMHVGGDRDGCQRKRQWIENVLNAGNHICLTIIEWVSDDLADVAERYWINELAGRGCLLTNHRTHYVIPVNYKPSTKFEYARLPDYIVTHKPHWLKEKERGHPTASDWARIRKERAQSFR